MEILIAALGCLVIFLVQLKLYRKYCFKQLDYNCFFSESEVYEGAEIEFTEEIENKKRLPLPVFKSELTASAYLDFADTHSAVTDGSRFVSSFFEVKGRCRVKRVWKIKCTRRGVYGIKNAVLVTSDIFGSEVFSLKPECRLPEITVLPSEYPFNADRIFSRNFCGDVPFKNPPFADPFFADGIREYTGTEPLKFINHSASAKENRLMVNTFDSSAESRMSVILDLSCHEKNAEHSIKVCCYLLQRLAKNGFCFGLYIPSDPELSVPHANGGEHLKRCLYALAKASVPEKQSDIYVPTEFLTNPVLITANEQTALSWGYNVIFTGYLSKPASFICVPERSDDNEKS
ncbi:MAG: DUF58 domain-containing protein [Oscillospiraceae bacterium]|nr:DUF58 domain-containing protein [Oscillospiraceae bacterium]